MTNMMCANIFFGGGRKRIKHVKSKSLDCSHSQKQIIRTFIFGHGYRYLASVFIRIPQPHRHFDPIDVVLSCAVFKAARKILMWNSNLCAIRAWVCVHCTRTRTRTIVGTGTNQFTRRGWRLRLRDSRLWTALR
jgi:hypothetical protein